MLLEELIGQTLVFGIPGPRVRAEDVRLFRETHAGGLILYRINFESSEQIRRLITDLESALGRRLLVTIDHEGGRVVMFGDGVTVFPDNLAFGVCGRVSYVRKQGEVEAKELRRLGVDVNFSPVADVLTDAFSPNIGIRSYGADPALVARLACARIRGMQMNGLSACAKHFPGLGPATLDPHLDLPVIRTGWKELRKTHLPPFRAAIDAGVDVVMSSHPLYPGLDPRPRTPATFSDRLIRGLLREELGFSGVISSDDLEMGAIKRLCGAGRAAVLAAKAGHDLLLSCHDAKSQRACFQSLAAAYQTGELSVENLEKSVERIRILKEKRARRFEGGEPRALPFGRRLADRVARQAVRMRPPRRSPLRGLWFRRFPSRTEPPLFSQSDRPPIVFFPRMKDLAGRILVEKSIQDVKSFIRKEAAATFAIREVPVAPSSSDIRSLVRIPSGASAVVFCLDAHLRPGWRRLVEELQRTERRVILVPLLDFYDEEFAGPETTVVTAFGARACQIRACLDFLFGKRR